MAFLMPGRAPRRGPSLLFGGGEVQPAAKKFVPSSGFSFGGAVDSVQAATAPKALPRASSKRSLSKRPTEEDDFGVGCLGGVIWQPPKRTPLPAPAAKPSAEEGAAATGSSSESGKPPAAPSSGSSDHCPDLVSAPAKPPKTNVAPATCRAPAPSDANGLAAGGGVSGPSEVRRPVFSAFDDEDDPFQQDECDERQQEEKEDPCDGEGEPLSDAHVPASAGKSAGTSIPQPVLPRLLQNIAEGIEERPDSLEVTGEWEKLPAKEVVGTTIQKRPSNTADNSLLKRPRAIGKKREESEKVSGAGGSANWNTPVLLRRRPPQEPEDAGSAGDLNETVVPKTHVPDKCANATFVDEVGVEHERSAPPVDEDVQWPQSAKCAKKRTIKRIRPATSAPSDLISQLDQEPTDSSGLAASSVDAPGNSAAKKPRAAPKRRQTKKKSALDSEEDEQVTKPRAKKTVIPYKANFVRNEQDRRMTTKGTTKNTKSVKKYFGKNGRLKPEYTRRADAQSQFDKENAAFRGSSKKQRYQHLQEQALSERSLVANGDSLFSAKAFSPSISQDMLRSLAASGIDKGLGEIAQSRPPDKTSSSASPSKLQSDEQNPVNVDPHQQSQDSEPSVNASQTLVEGAPEESRPCPPDELEGMRDTEVPQLHQRRPEDFTTEDLRDVLRGTFHHEDFRPGQHEAISSVLASQKTLLLLSTGAGKSLCYQIPAYLLREEGLTLVVSPLVSLMMDQLNRLPRCLRGAIVSGQQTRIQVRTVMKAVRARLIDVLYISPERLSMWAFDGCGLPPIALACIDEAHCVSEWSHNFRPDYLRLHEFLVGSLGARRLLGLTATATRPTVKSVCEILQMDVIVRSDRSYQLQELLDEPAQPRVQRPNLTMDVKRVDSEEAQVKALVDLLKSPEHGNRSTIIYVWRKMSCDQLAKQLRKYVRGGVSAYHAGLLPETRRAVQEAFMVGTARVVVATMAFGMGLDKPDIRLVVHYNIPKSIEHYVQETGRCSRDGEPGHCITLVNNKDYKSMRWITSGGGGNSAQAGIVRRLLALIFSPPIGGRKRCSRFELSAEAVAEACNGQAITDVPESFQPYYVSFEESEVAKELNIQQDELHSVLTHFAHRAKGHVVLHSKFPTQMKMRFFRTDPEELAKQDFFLKKIIPLARKHSGVYTVDTAKALAQLGGQPSQLSNGLWQAQGDEFSVEKAEYGYMVAVLRPADEVLVESWVADIVTINQLAHRNSITKLDSVYCAFVRAGEASVAEPVGPSTKSPSAESTSAEHDAQANSPNNVLTGLIDAYFAATDDPSAVVAGDGREQVRMLRQALGADYIPPTRTQQSMQDGSGGSTHSGDMASQKRQVLEGNAVYSVVARLMAGQDWPTLPSDDPSAISHAVAQFLAGIGTPMLPAKKWKDHRCWGRFKEFQDFECLEELVGSAHARFQSARAAQRAKAAGL